MLNQTFSCRPAGVLVSNDSYYCFTPSGSISRLFDVGEDIFDAGVGQIKLGGGPILC